MDRCDYAAVYEKLLFWVANSDFSSGKTAKVPVAIHIQFNEHSPAAIANRCPSLGAKLYPRALASANGCS
jgi:hypothetical protein